jgi:hypothetical protein
VRRAGRRDAGRLAVTAAWHGGWWVDAVIGLAIAAASAWEGAESWRGGECGC